MTVTAPRTTEQRPGRGTSAGRATATSSFVASSFVTTSVLFIAALYFLLPLLWLFFAATKSTSGLSDSFGLWFAEDVQLWQNVVDAMQYLNGSMPRWLFNSVLYSTVGAAVSAVVSSMAGFALAKYEFRGKGVVFGAIIAGVLIPPAVLVLPLFLMLAGVGLTNTIWAVLLPSMISPFGVYLGRVFAESAIPNGLMEAARLDGAGDIRFFFTIGIRLMGPAFVTMFLFQFVGIWNNFALPLVMLADDELYPLTLALWQLNSLVAEYPEHRPVLMAGTLISIVPLILAFCFLQRFWRAGLAAGAMKD
ncbi:carbohydrate ABC transporter permease [Actinomycetes bacterium KLBMP 9759]